MAAQDRAQPVPSAAALRRARRARAISDGHGHEPRCPAAGAKSLAGGKARGTSDSDSPAQRSHAARHVDLGDLRVDPHVDLDDFHAGRHVDPDDFHAGPGVVPCRASGPQHLMPLPAPLATPPRLPKSKTPFDARSSPLQSRRSWFELHGCAARSYLVDGWATLSLREGTLSLGKEDNALKVSFGDSADH